MCILKYFKFKHLAYYDLLCNCHNRNFLEDKLFDKYAHKSTYITMIDIDYFKNVNDSLGHLIGDKILHGLVELVSHNDSINYICRYGGDEFIILHNKDIDFNKYNEAFIDINGVSFSYGTVFKEKYDSINDALAEADKELYKVKKGR